jgi:hypothetical protein
VFIDDFLQELVLSNPTISQSTWDAAFFGGLLSFLILIGSGSSSGKRMVTKKRKKKAPRSTVVELGDPSDPALLSVSKSKPESPSRGRRSLSPSGNGKPETPLQRARREAREAHELAVEQHISSRKK